MLRGMRGTIEAFFRTSRFEKEMRDELRTHIECRADDLAATGVLRDEALRRARLEFGALEAWKEDCRDARGFAVARVMNGAWLDLRLAARRLAATPLFTVFAVVSLAIGIGVTTAIYSVVASIFFRGLGVGAPQTVGFVMTAVKGRPEIDRVSPADLDELRGRLKSFTSIAASERIAVAVASLRATEQFPGEAVDASYFSTLGVNAVLGRTILPSDDVAASPVLVLSHRLWRLRFAGDPGVIGGTVRLSGHPFEIIGVAPDSFEGPIGRLSGTLLWVPLACEPLVSQTPPASTAERDRGRLTVIGRLRPGRTIANASAELAAIAAALDAARARRRPQTTQPERRAWSATSLADLAATEDVIRPFAFAIIGLVALVLVVACTNLSNLVLARGILRQQEFAVRRALGASRWRLVREQCAESALLGGAGAVASLVVFEAVDTLLSGDLPLGASSILSIRPELNLPALLVAGGALLLSLEVFGLEPAIQLTRASDIRAAMAEAPGGAGTPRTTRQRTLLRWQVAISTGFFIIATMCVRYTIAEAWHDSGIDLDRVAIAILNFDARNWDAVRTRQTLDRVAEEAAKDPAVRTVTVSTGLPFGTSQLTQLVYLSVPGSEATRQESDDGSLAVAATPSIFRTIGVSILRGRAFDDRDSASAPPVVVLPAATARHLFGTVDAVGRQVAVQHWKKTSHAVMTTVVGVASDTDVDAQMYRDTRLIYLPFAQQDINPPLRLSVIVRAAGKPVVAARALQDAIRKVDPDLATVRVGTGRLVLGGLSVLLRAAGFGSLGLGALTLLLAMIGLYGVQSHVVARRTREIGVRMSLGATAGDIRKMVLRDGYRPILEGLAIGLFIGFAGRAIVRAYLFFFVRISLVDPWVLALIPTALVLAGFWACYLPAARAARVDPNTALRTL